MQTWEWVVIAVVLAGAVVFTLAWWWLADKWADSEHKRFKGKSGPAGQRIVIKNTGAAPQEGAQAPAPAPDTTASGAPRAR